MNMPGAPRILLQMNSIFRVRFAWYLVAAVVAGFLLYLAAPVLSPFLFAAILAYICLPLVDLRAAGIRASFRILRRTASTACECSLVGGFAASACAISGQGSL